MTVSAEAWPYKAKALGRKILAEVAQHGRFGDLVGLAPEADLSERNQQGLRNQRISPEAATSDARERSGVVSAWATC
jgi:hypothetical protein